MGDGVRTVFVEAVEEITYKTRAFYESEYQFCNTEKGRVFIVYDIVGFESNDIFSYSYWIYQ